MDILSTDNWLFWILVITLFGGFLVLPLFWVFRKSQEKSEEKNFLQKIFQAVTLPFNFGAIFLEERRIEDLPFYYRWYLGFVHFTSRVKYFHFLPKALIALSAEWIITVFTGQDILTALIFSWSVLFLFLVTLVEHHSGEMEEKTVIFANKIFLYSVSMLTLILLFLYFFFWGIMQDFLDVPFLHFMGKMAHGFNEYLIAGWNFFIGADLWMQLSIIGIITLYIVSSLVLSKKESQG